MALPFYPVFLRTKVIGTRYVVFLAFKLDAMLLSRVSTLRRMASVTNSELLLHACFSALLQSDGDERR